LSNIFALWISLEDQVDGLEPAAMDVDELLVAMDLDGPPLDQGEREQTVAELGLPGLQANQDADAAVREVLFRGIGNLCFIPGDK
jgi:hypothetical protein